MFSRSDSCAFTKTNIEDAFGPEVSLFLHCHLRGYDKNGEGEYPDQGMCIVARVLRKQTNKRPSKQTSN